MKIFKKLWKILRNWIGFSRDIKIRVDFLSPEQACAVFGMDQEEELIEYLSAEIKKALEFNGEIKENGS